MEHFPVVLGIIRAGRSGDQIALERQVARLRKRIEQEGLSKEGQKLSNMLKKDGEHTSFSPSKVVLSSAQIHGETLSPETHLPIDRETGADLCSVKFPNNHSVIPIYNTDTEETIIGLLEEWSKAEILESIGVHPTRTLLVCGPPGSGKTITAHYIAEKLNLPLVTARIDGLISSFLGTTARNIANLFEFANRYSCVLLLDEFDALAKLRDDPHELGEIKRVVNTLLQNLDDRKDLGITIAITNHDKLLDPAVWRRFEAQVQFKVPDTLSRERLVKRFLDPLKPRPAIYQIFGYCLVGRTGADIEQICLAVKRMLALSDSTYNSPTIFRSFGKVLRRSMENEHIPAQLLVEDEEAFISYLANDSEFKMTQSAIGEATGFGQSRVSELKKVKRHLDIIGNSYA